MPRTSGYSAAQIALHWAVVVLVAAQYVFKGTIAAAWDAIVAGRASAISIRVRSGKII